MPFVREAGEHMFGEIVNIYSICGIEMTEDDTECNGAF